MDLDCSVTLQVDAVGKRHIKIGDGWMLKSRKMLNLLWWRFMPGDFYKLNWPTGRITVDDKDPRWDWTLSATLQEFYSADPNDHYRPWIEQYVGRQGWDWDWMMLGNDCADNTLTLKVRRGKEQEILLVLLKWQ